MVVGNLFPEELTNNLRWLIKKKKKKKSSEIELFSTGSLLILPVHC